MTTSNDTTNVLIGVTSVRFLYAQRWTTLLQQSLGDHFNIIPEGLNGRTCILETTRHIEEGENDFNC